MAFKMRYDKGGFQYGEGAGAPFPKKPLIGKSFGTGSGDLTNIDYKERTKYRSWKRQQRQAGKKGSHHDNTYEAYLRSKNTQPIKPRKSRKGLGIGDWLRRVFKPGDGGKKLLPTTIAQKRKGSGPKV